MKGKQMKKQILKVTAACFAGAILSAGTMDAEEGIQVKSGDSIAFLGDSITQQGAGSSSGYVNLVISGLKANGVEAKCIPAGISGHKSNNMLERLDKDVIDKKPVWMTLSCGVNDVWHGANGVPLDKYKENITAIVDKAQAAGIKVMILTSTMIGEDDNPNNKKLEEYNAFLREIAGSKKCLLADLNADMRKKLDELGGAKKGQNLLTGDGVHMNPFGNMMMATGVLRAFGLNDEQIKKAEEFWRANATVQVPVSITLGRFEQLGKAAKGQNKSISQLLEADLEKANAAQGK